MNQTQGKVVFPRGVLIASICAIIVGSTIVLVSIHTKPALAGLTNGTCNVVEGGTYRCFDFSGVEKAPTVGQHIALNAGVGSCHVNVTSVGNGAMIVFIAHDVGGCPFSVTDSQPLTLVPPPHVTPAVVICTKASTSATYWCSSALASDQHIELRVNQGICHGSVASSVTGGSVPVAEVRVTENVSSCPISLMNTNVQFQYVVGSPSPPPTVTFTDVPANSYARDWIYQLAADGITKGCGNTTYCPDEKVTRAQMAVFLLRVKNGSTYEPPVVP